MLASSELTDPRGCAMSSHKGPYLWTSGMHIWPLLQLALSAIDPDAGLSGSWARRRCRLASPSAISSRVISSLATFMIAVSRRPSAQVNFPHETSRDAAQGLGKCRRNGLSMNSTDTEILPRRQVPPIRQRDQLAWGQPKRLRKDHQECRRPTASTQALA